MDPLTTMKEMYRRYKPRKVLKFVMADRKRQFAAVAVVAIMVVAIFAVLSRPGGDGTEDADFPLIPVYQDPERGRGLHRGVRR
jgi:hypothetical protein